MMILAATLLVLLSGIALIRAILQDGYGSRPAPRSHHRDLGPIPSHGERWML